jgi:hypothetical protein
VDQIYSGPIGHQALSKVNALLVKFHSDLWAKVCLDRRGVGGLADVAHGVESVNDLFAQLLPLVKTQ